MASSVKVTLRKKPNKQGQYPLAVRITKDRRTSYLYTGQFIELKYWDASGRVVRKSHPNAARLNNLLLAKLSEANKKLLDLQTTNTDISSKQIKKEISAPLNKTTFKELSESYLLEIKANGKLSRYASDKVRVNHLQCFAENNYLTFKEIDEAFLRRFMSYLKVTKKVSQRSIVNNLVVIRTLYNRAIKQGIVDRKHYPFGADKIRIKFPETEKVGLTIEEIQNIEELNNLSKQECHVRNVWLFSFYLAGMRVSDVLQIRWNDIYDDRLHYRMNKNDKLLSLKLPNKLLPILQQYVVDKVNDTDFIFPEMKKANMESMQDIFAKTKTATKKFNKYLKSIAQKAKMDKKLTMHIARHSFGNIAGDKIPIQMLQKLYRHSSVTTTINYQANFMHKDADDALEKVINF
ncbi:site-specific integrase [Kriegella aquimaris]|uniref:Site-specific recombinase XerD n=1 Tax=Kriegella aquimaris TaxID=192904 RepID=A0A1G9TLK1_9FLAO|nr:site-specific integrase [Kriegella aquimaris]SDM48607.1 Site-specific recombinase XerD [Kriegella aquimaris]